MTAGESFSKGTAETKETMEIDLIDSLLEAWATGRRGCLSMI